MILKLIDSELDPETALCLVEVLKLWCVRNSLYFYTALLLFSLTLICTFTRVDSWSQEVRI